MSEPPDLSALAKRYVELWQDYLTAASADPALADSLARLLAGVGTAVPWQAWLAGILPRPVAAAPSADDQAPSRRAEPAERRDGAAAAWPAPAAAPSHERDD